MMAREPPARSFKHDGTPYSALSPADDFRNLVSTCTEIVENTSTWSSTDMHRNQSTGLYSGLCGQAYLFFRLSELYPDLEIRGKSCLDLAKLYLSHIKLSEWDPDPSHCGIDTNKLAYLTLKALLSDTDVAARSIAQVCAYSRSILSNNEPNEHSNEWLYGRAGYLHFLRLLRSHLDTARDNDTADLINRTIEQVVSTILTSPRPWTWHGKQHLGAAHGDIGIITQVVLASPATAPALEKRLSELLDLQLPSGNFPSSVPVHGGDRLVQFCHGAPGWAASLISLRSHFSNLGLKIDTTLSKARSCVWDRGLLTKTPSLCHGISGNALVLETDEQKRLFLSFTTQAALEDIGFVGGEHGVRRWMSLYTGAAGRAWAWAAVDKGLDGQFIGYNDI